MADIAIRFDPDTRRFDLVSVDGTDGGGLVTDGDLTTAVLATLFTDGRARQDDELPGFDGDRRGHWADSFPALPGHAVGGRLWTVRRLATAESLAKIEAMLAEDLAWTVEIGLAGSVRVQLERSSTDPVAVLGRIVLVRPDGADLTVRFDTLWEETGNA